MKPDIGILSKDFLKSKGREQQQVDKQFAIHRKKLAAAVDVEEGRSVMVVGMIVKEFTHIVGEISACGLERVRCV